MTDHDHPSGWDPTGSATPGDPTAPLPTGGTAGFSHHGSSAAPHHPHAAASHDPYGPATDHGYPPAFPGHDASPGQAAGPQPWHTPAPYPGHAQAPAAYPWQTAAYPGHAPAGGSSASAIVLTIVSGVLMLVSCFSVGLPSVVLGGIAVAQHASDPLGSRRLATVGWVVLGVNLALVALAVVVLGAGLWGLTQDLPAMLPTPSPTSTDVGY